MMTSEILNIIEDVEMRLSVLAKARVKISLQFDRNILNEKEEMSDEEIIMHLIYKEFGVESIDRAKRTKEYTDARFAFMYLAKKYLLYSTNKIASILNRDHATVINGLNNAHGWMEQPLNYFAKRVKEIEKNFLNTKHKNDESKKESKHTN